MTRARRVGGERSEYGLGGLLAVCVVDGRMGQGSGGKGKRGEGKGLGAVR